MSIKINQFQSPIVTSTTLFYVKTAKSTSDSQISPSGFCSSNEAAAFWKNLNPTSFPSKLRNQGPSVETIVRKVGPLKSDVSDIVLTVMFSDVLTTSHPSMFGPNAHPVLRKRSNQPSVKAADSKDNEAKPKTNISKPIKGAKATIAALVSNKIIPKSTNPSFKEMFPATDLPHIHLLNGLPKVNKAIFNSLLISKLRAAKTNLKLTSSDRLDSDVVKHISRLIDKSLVSALNTKKEVKDKKPANAKATAPPKPLKAKGKTTRRTVEFVSASVDTTPSPAQSTPKADSSVPKPTPTLSMDDQTLSLIDEGRIKSIVGKPANCFTVRDLETLTSFDPEQINHHLYVRVEQVSDVYDDCAPSVIIQNIRVCNPESTGISPTPSQLVNGYLTTSSMSADYFGNTPVSKLLPHLKRIDYLSIIVDYFKTHVPRDA
jgi:hypothetical protein